MKDKTGWITGLLLAFTLAMLCVVGCAGPGNLKEQRNIATACAAINAAGNAIAAATVAGKVTKADAQKALAIAKPTAAFCEPKPVDHLGPVEYAVLLNAAADLATKKDAIP